MNQSNFILTDIMKTGNHLLQEGYVRFNSLSNQSFDMTGEYYMLHNFDLKKYDRRFALIDVRQDNQRLNCKEFDNELARRMANLKSLGFCFIYSTPWESKENYETNKQEYYPKKTFEGHHWFGGVSWFWYYMVIKHIQSKFKINHYKKTFDFLYLNKQTRKHRLELYTKLLDKKLLTNSLTSFIDHPSDPHELRKNYELPWLDKKQSYPYYGSDQDIYEKPYNETIASIVSETNDNNTDIFMTEKIWKPILMKQIFIVHGNQNYLEKLKQLGFKTFDNIIDESYDQEEVKNFRIDKIVAAVKSLKDRSYIDLYNETQQIREHNAKQFFNKTVLNKVINDELLSWFEFFDSGQISSTKT